MPPVPPPPSNPPREKRGLADRLLMMAGVSLALAAAAFPWYVFLNPQKFSFRNDAVQQARDMPAKEAKSVFSIAPMAVVNSNPTPQKLPKDIDRMQTATLPQGPDAPDGKGGEALAQPFPGSVFRLLHVANGQALIEDSSGMYMVKVGSVLPDNSRLARLEQKNGKWVIITSTGAIYENQ
ncbi:flagellar protein [Allorhizobium sp. BGMRC 0089]|uniref:flagellar protein n=1 Tax=Allorhizobium sonneratiae TaxID=2934936 RepID=UPI0020339B4B|nr:flagellar protein [Allorhizobium sonneratiae]MCM2291404.1 flagellar protein [Allorhizobium sonneratiae]